MPALASVGIAVRGSLELGLGHQAPAAPVCIRESFRLADVDRPRQWQRHLVKHPTPDPSTLRIAMPELRMREFVLANPRPVGWAPPPRIGVAARGHEFQEVGVADVVLLDRERRYVDTTMRPFVVPRERLASGIDSK